MPTSYEKGPVANARLDRDAGNWSWWKCFQKQPAFYGQARYLNDKPACWFSIPMIFWLGTGASNPMSDWKNFLLSTLLDTGPHDKQFLGPQRPPTWCPMQKRMPCLMHRKGIGALPYFLLVPARNCFRWVHDGAAVRCWTIHSFMNHWISRVYTIVISYDRNLKVTKEKWKFSWWCSFSMYLQG